MPTLAVAIDARRAKQGADEAAQALRVVQQEAAETKADVDRLDKSLDELGPSGKEAAQGAKSLDTALTGLSGSATAASRATKQLGDDSQRLDSLFQGAANEYGNAFRQIPAAVGEADEATKRYERTLGGTSNAAATLRRNLAGVLAGFTIAAGIRESVQAITSFEATMSALQVTSAATSEQMERLEETARRLGATTRFTASEAGEALLEFSRAGFSAAEAIDAAPGALDLASAGLLGLAESAELTVNVLSQFGLQAVESGRVGDVLVKAANSSSTSVRELGESLKFVGPLSGTLNISLEQTTAAIGALGDAGLKASEGGTQLRGVLTDLLSPSNVALGAIERLGLTIEDLNPATNDLVEISRTLQAAQLDAAAAVDIFGQRNAVGALILADNAQKVARLSAELEKSAGEARNQSAAIENNVRGAFRQLASAAQEATLRLGDGGLTGAMRGVIDTATGTIRILSGVEGAEQDASTSARLLTASIEGLVVAYGSLVAIRTVQSLAQQVQAFRATLTAVDALTGVVVQNRTAWSALAGVLSANPIGLTVAGIGAAVAAIAFFNDGLSEAEERARKLRDTIVDLKSSIEGVADAQAAFVVAQNAGDARGQVDAIQSEVQALQRAQIELQKRLTADPQASVTSSDFSRLLPQGRDVAVQFVEDLVSGLQAEGESRSLAQQRLFLKLITGGDEDATSLREEVSKRIGQAIGSDIAAPDLARAFQAFQTLPTTTGSSFAEQILGQFDVLFDAEQALDRIADRIFDLRNQAQGITAENGLAKGDRSAQVAIELEQKALAELIKARERERDLLLLSSKDKEVFVALQEAEAASTKLSADERQKALDTLEKQIRTNQDLVAHQEIAKEIVEDQKREAKARDDARRSLDEYLASLQREAELAGQSKDVREQLEAVDKRRQELSKVGLTLSDKEAETIRRYIQEQQRLKAAEEARQKDAVAGRKERDEENRSLVQGQAEVEKLLQQLEDEQKLIGLTTEEREIAVAVRNFERAAIKAGELDLAGLVSRYALEYAALVQRKKAIDDAAKAQKDADQDRDRARQRLDDLTRSIEDEIAVARLSNDERERAIKLLEIERTAREAGIPNVEAFVEAQARQLDILKKAQDVQRIADDAADAITSNFQDFALGAKEAEDAVFGLIKALEQLAFQELFTTPLRGALSGFIGDLLGGGSSNGIGAQPVTAPLKLNALGGAYQGGDVVPFQFGGVLDRPALFPLNGGRAGLAGEAGPEGILPLRRDSSGRLGVSASGGGGRTVNVQMTVIARDADSFRQSRRQIENDLKRIVQ